MLTIALLATALADPGDTCGQATVLTPDTSVFGNTVNRLPDPAGTCGTAATGGGVWYTFTAPDDGVLDLSTCAGPLAQQISVYEDGCGTLTCVDGADDACSVSSLEVAVDAGVTYHILVHENGTSGVYELTNTFTPAAVVTVEPPMDCTGRIPAVCQLTNRVVSLINSESGSLVMTEGASSSRFRPTNLYTKFAAIHAASSSNSCSLLGTMGGVYDFGAGTWNGSDFIAFVGASPASGAIARPGAWSGSEGLFAPYGSGFGVYNHRGQLAATSGQTSTNYAMGTWIRIAGGLGVYGNIAGNCGTQDVGPIFDPWYAGSLPSGGVNF